MITATFRRIVIVGDPCTGKSTLAKHFADALRVEHVELDALYWRRHWTPTPDSELIPAMERAASDERWVMSGNYLRCAQQAIWPRADLIVWLDLPLRVVLPRLVRRTWRRWRTHELLWGSNVEDPWQHLRVWERDRNLFTFTLLTHHRRRMDFAQALADTRWQHLRFIRLCTSAEIKSFASTFAPGQLAIDETPFRAPPFAAKPPDGTAPPAS